MRNGRIKDAHTVVMNYDKEMLMLLKLKYPDIYNKLDMEWRIEKTNEVLKNCTFNSKCLLLNI